MPRPARRAASPDSAPQPAAAGGELHVDFPRTRDFVRGVLRAEKARRNLTYPDLSRMLREYGIEQSPSNLGTKIHRGMMSAQLFVALLAVMGITSLDLEEVAIARKGM